MAELTWSRGLVGADTSLSRGIFCKPNLSLQFWLRRHEGKIEDWQTGYGSASIRAVDFVKTRPAPDYRKPASETMQD